MTRHFFTSEAVSEGHPDKICDQIADAVLDECLAQDAESHVACEVFATSSLVVVGGEITSNAVVDARKIATEVVRDIGYNETAAGLDADAMTVLNCIHRQSPDINRGVAGIGLDEFRGQQGAGDQGMMFGFACSETPEFMPFPVTAAQKLLLKAAELRKSGVIPFLRPDAKSQVTVEYEDGRPVRIDAVVLSHQHSADADWGSVRDAILNNVVHPVLDSTGLLDEKTKFYINPTGRFVIGGPTGDTGLTGRKIIADTYGGMGRHGGGAFSGKDPSKVDRSASYMARYIAKNIVAAKLARRCEIQLSYAIGVPFPISIMIETFGTGRVEDCKIAAAVEKVFDCTPAGIVRTLDLKRPIYSKTACYGHFGRDEFPWEKCDMADAILKAL